MLCVDTGLGDAVGSERPYQSFRRTMAAALRSVVKRRGASGGGSQGDVMARLARASMKLLLCSALAPTFPRG